MLGFASSPSTGVHNRVNKQAMEAHRQFHNRALLPVVIIFLVFSYSSVALRLWTRAHFLKRLGWDDYIILTSVMFFTFYCSTVLAMFIQADDARGIRDVPVHHVEEVASLLIVTECFYILAMIALKLSLAIFFLRVLVTRWQRWIIVTTITLSTLFGVFYFFFAIFQCGYFSNITVFIHRMVRGQCASMSIGLGMNYTYAALATTSDWACVVIPIFVLRESTMPLRRKFVVGGLMLFASLGSVASIVRMLYLHSITIPTGKFFVNISKLSIWSTVEPGVGITVASLATLRPLFSKLVERTRRASSSSYSSQHQSSTGNNAHTHATSTASQTRDDSVGMSSDTTAVAPSSYRPLDDFCQTVAKYNLRTSKEEKVEDIEAEMRAYGMSDDRCATLEEENFDRYTPEVRRERENERRMRWFQSQRALRSQPAQDNILRTASPSRPIDQNLSSRREQINGRVKGWRDDFALDA